MICFLLSIPFFLLPSLALCFVPMLSAPCSGLCSVLWSLLSVRCPGLPSVSCPCSLFRALVSVIYSVPWSAFCFVLWSLLSVPCSVLCSVPCSVLSVPCSGLCALLRAPSSLFRALVSALLRARALCFVFRAVADFWLVPPSLPLVLWRHTPDTAPPLWTRPTLGAYTDRRTVHQGDPAPHARLTTWICFGETGAVIRRGRCARGKWLPVGWRLHPGCAAGVRDVRELLV